MTKRNKRKLTYLLFVIAACCGIFAACSSAAVYAPETLRMLVGDEAALGAVVIPFGSDEKITYSSSDPAVATVSANGTVTALSAGKAEITSKIRARAATTTVKVDVPAESISFSTARKYYFSLEGSNNKPVSDFFSAIITEPQDSVVEVEWSSGDETVAKITNGKIELLAVGAVEIIATDIRTGNTASFVGIVLDDAVYAGINASGGIKIIDLQIITASHYILYGEILRQDLSVFELLGTHNKIAGAGQGLDTVYAHTDPRSLSNGIFGITAGRPAADEIIIHVYKQFPLDVFVDPQYYSPSAVYVWRAESLGWGEFIAKSASRISRSDLLEFFSELYGEPTEITPAPSEEGTQYTYVFEQTTHPYRGSITFQITIEEYNGLSHITTKIFVSEGANQD